MKPLSIHSTLCCWRNVRQFHHLISDFTTPDTPDLMWHRWYVRIGYWRRATVTLES